MTKSQAYWPVDRRRESVDVLDKQWADDDPEHYHTTSRFCNIRPVDIYTCLLMTTLCILLGIHIFNRTHECTSSFTDGREFHTQLGQNYDYMSLDHRFDYLWEEDIRSGADKIVELDDGNEYFDVTGKSLGNPASISMFHQLHCLAGLRKALQDAHEGKDPGLDFHDNKHWPHCLDYLRRSIRCWADFTLEHPIQIDNGSALPGINGATALRTCRRVEPLYEFVHDHKMAQDNPSRMERPELSITTL